jgi:hypothetical protein
MAPAAFPRTIPQRSRPLGPRAPTRPQVAHSPPQRPQVPPRPPPPPRRSWSEGVWRSFERLASTGLLPLASLSTSSGRPGAPPPGRRWLHGGPHLRGTVQRSRRSPPGRRRYSPACGLPPIASTRAAGAGTEPSPGRLSGPSGADRVGDRVTALRGKGGAREPSIGSPPWGAPCWQHGTEQHGTDGKLGASCWSPSGAEAVRPILCVLATQAKKGW